MPPQDGVSLGSPIFEPNSRLDLMGCLIIGIVANLAIRFKIIKYITTF